MTQNTEIRDVVLELDRAGLDARQRRTVIEAMNSYRSIGEAAFWNLSGVSRHRSTISTFELFALFPDEEAADENPQGVPFLTLAHCPDPAARPGASRAERSRVSSGESK
jgi:hypothetical protein